MTRKPTTAEGYRPESVERAYATSLYVATKLGDLLDDMVIIGGLVPTLIIPQGEFSENRSIHVGTMDVDLGLAIAVLNEERYHEIRERLRNAEFEPGKNDEGNVTSQTWEVDANGNRVTVDFLIPPTMPGDKGGQLRNLERDFAAIITPGLELSFRDRQQITLSGTTIRGEQAERTVGVCGAGAFTILKALSFAGRGENKDAYDLIYVLQNYGEGVAEIAERIRPLLDDENAQRAIKILKSDFTSADGAGPILHATFLGDPNDEIVCADAAGSVRDLLSKLD